MKRTLRVSLLAALLASVLAWSAAEAQQLTFTPRHADGIYAVGERVGWTVAPAPGQSAAPGRYSYTIKRDGMEVIGTGTVDPSSAGATIETSLSRPGMVLVEVRPPAGTTGFRGESKSEVGRVLLGAAVAPTSIRPAAPPPADFDSFWAAKLSQLQAVPAEPVLTPGESGRPGIEYFTIRMNNIGGAHVYGQIAKPEGNGPFPALLIFQWASPPYPLQRQWVTDRAAEGWLVFNVEPHDVPSDMPQAFYDALPQLIKNYYTIGRHSRDESYFLRMYLGDVRAAQYLAGRPDWDGRTMVVMGISMGGQQSFAVAGLEPRVTALVVDVPAGGDALGPLHGRAALYPNWDVSRADIRETARYFDVSTFAARTTARSLVAVGFIDETCPPAGVWAVFNQLRGPKEIVPMVDSPHNHMATPEEHMPWTHRSAEWLDVLVHGGDPTAGADRR
jgi:cephalosporin-C deacetylase-like acetyl esterase